MFTSRLLSLSSFLVRSTRYCYCCISLIDDNIYLCNITIAKKLIEHHQARIRVAVVYKLCKDNSNNYAIFNRQCLLEKLNKLSKRDVRKSWLPAWLRWVSIINKRVLKITHVKHILVLYLWYAVAASVLYGPAVRCQSSKRLTSVFRKESPTNIDRERKCQHERARVNGW